MHAYVAFIRQISIVSRYENSQGLVRGTKRGYPSIHCSLIIARIHGNGLQLLVWNIKN